MKSKFITLTAIALSTMMLVSSCGGAKKPTIHTEDSQETVSSITITQASTEIEMGKTLKLRATVKGIENPELIWASSDTNVAVVDANGVVLAKDVTKDTKVTITVTVKGHEDIKGSVELTVKYLIKEGRVFITSVSENSNFLAHKSNAKLPNDDEDKFKVSDRMHLVGDDNEIDLKPVSMFKQYIGGKLTDIPYEGEWDYNLTLSVKEGENYTKLAGNSELIESIDTKKCTINFSDKAINKEFKVRLEPKDLTENQQNDKDYEDLYVANYDFKVVDGYNIYNAKELSLIENRNPGIEVDKFERDSAAIKAWNDFKTANSINKDLHPNTVLLQTNIKLTKDDVPELFFYSDKDVNIPNIEGIMGSLKDDQQIYAHYTKLGETFNFYGNYFAIDAQDFPLIKSDHNEDTAKDQVIVPETELFGFVASNHTNITDEQFASTNANLIDIKFLGNAPKREEVIYSGGVLLANSKYMSLSIDNVITKRWYQSFSINQSPLSTLSIKETISKDNYSSFVYIEGAKQVDFVNSLFDSCGGPAFIITDCVGTGTTLSHTPCDLKITNSKVNSYVNGTEGWFQGLGITPTVSNITALDQALNMGNRSFLSTSKSHGQRKYFNFISVHMSSELDLKDVMSGKASPIQGSVTFDNGSKFDIDGSSDPEFKKIYETESVKNHKFLFRTNYETAGSVSKTSSAYFDGVKEFKEASGNPVGPQSGVFKGDKVAVYALGFMFTFDYHEMNHEIA